MTALRTDPIVLTDDEHDRGFSAPYRRTYRHEACGTVTALSPLAAEAHARQAPPEHAYCSGCRRSFPVDAVEFTWLDGTRIGAVPSSLWNGGQAGG